MCKTTANVKLFNYRLTIILVLYIMQLGVAADI